MMTLGCIGALVLRHSEVHSLLRVRDPAKDSGDDGGIEG